MRRYLGVLLCVLCAVGCFGWIVAGPTMLGNDYPFTQAINPLEYRFYRSVGVLPIWYPHISGGLPYGGRFAAQLFHLPAWLMSLAPGFDTGQELRVLAVKHLLLIILCQWVFLDCFRRFLSWPLPAAFLASFVLTFQLRRVDELRFGVYLDAVVYLQSGALLAIAYLRLGGWWRLVLVALLAQCFITSGFYPMAAFGGVGLILCAAWVLHSGWADRERLPRRGLYLLGAALIGVLLAAPNWLPMLDFMSLNFRRVVGADIAWADEAPLTSTSLLANLAAPWWVEVHSGFAGTTLFAIALLSLIVFGAARWKERWPLFVGLLFPIVYALGRVTPLFELFFRYIPGFHSVRYPGRMLSDLPLLMAVAVIVACPGRGPWLSSLREWRLPVQIAAAVSLVLLSGVSLLELSSNAGPFFAPAGIRGSALQWGANLVNDLQPWSAALRGLWLGAGILLSCALLWLSSLRVPPAARKLLGAAVLALTVVQAYPAMRYGTWTLPRQAMPTLDDFRRADHLPMYGSAPLQAFSVLADRSFGSATEDYTAFMNTAGGHAPCYLPVEPRLTAIVLPFYLTADLWCFSDEGALRSAQRTLGCDPGSAGRALLLAKDCSALGITPAASKAGLNQGNRIVTLSPNGFSMRIAPPAAALLVTSFPWAKGRWSTRIDGADASMVKVDGSFVGVPVQAGEHIVSVYRISARTLWSYRLAAAAATACLLAFGLWLRNRFKGLEARGRIAAVALLAFLAVLDIVAIRAASTYQDSVYRPVLLNNSYSSLLEEQLFYWKTWKPVRGSPSDDPQDIFVLRGVQFLGPGR